VSATKVIHRTGILDSIIAFDNGAMVTTKNIAYDSETGQALMSETANEFKDKYYTLKVPAHWVESGMSHACINMGNEYQMDSYSRDGFAIIRVPDMSARDNLFNKGDEIFIKEYYSGNRFWVDSVDTGTPFRVRIIDRNGNFPVLSISPSNPAYIKIIRSGKRNMQTIPVGEITMQENPIVTTGSRRRLTETWNRVVNASAVKYIDHWQTYNIQRVTLPTEQCSCNENKNGISVIQQILGWFTSSTGPHNLDFSNLVVPPGIVSDADRLRYFGSGPLVISSSTYGNCAEIRLNESCTLSLCARDGETISGGINSISTISSASNTIASGNLGCEDNYSFSAEINFAGEGVTYVTSAERSARIIGQSSCIPLILCQPNPSSYSHSACDMVTGIPVNPYVEGIRGNYRPLATYVYNNGERISSSASSPLGLNESGFYENFHPFWDCRAFGGTRVARPGLWTTTSKITKIDPNGRALETKDAIGIYSADLYGFNKNLVIASAQNATYSQIVFESFEDSDYPVGIANGGCPLLKHWSLYLPPTSDTPAGVIDQSMSHTGKNSLRLFPRGSQSLNVSLSPIENHSTSGFAYLLNSRDLAGYFKPTPGEYYVSAWVKLDVEPYDDRIYDTYRSARVSVNGVELNNRTNIIDGWQQVWGTITIREGQSQLPFALNAGSAFTNVDDIRIQPANSSMKTYVYRLDNLRLCAELDENNFATLYEYDDEGALTRTKKETERGVMTIQEVRFANPKNH